MNAQGVVARDMDDHSLDGDARADVVTDSTTNTTTNSHDHCDDDETSTKQEGRSVSARSDDWQVTKASDEGAGGRGCQTLIDLALLTHQPRKILSLIFDKAHVR